MSHQGNWTNVSNKSSEIPSDCRWSVHEVRRILPSRLCRLDIRYRALARMRPRRVRGNGLSWCAKRWPSSVHFRARGERVTIRLQPYPCHGSSPRTRGTAPDNRRKSRIGRFIPAHAGNGLRRSCRSRKFPVHPRARGERQPLIVASTTGAGSSPRTRGTGHSLCARPPGRRFIPAHAGNGSDLQPHGRLRAVHPRARGERGRRAPGATPTCGSSPRTRGTEGGGRCEFRYLRDGAVGDL